MRYLPRGRASRQVPEIVKQAIGPALPALPQIRELEGRESRAVRIHSGFRELKEYLRSC